MSRSLTLRPGTPADLAEVEVLPGRSDPRLLAADYPPSVMVLALPVIARARPELLASDIWWLAQEADGRIVGAGGWTRAAGPTATGDDDDGTGYVRQVVTDAACVRQGIGRALMAQVMAQAQAAGVRRLDCLSSRTAVPFYASLGFQERGAVEAPLRPGIDFPAVRMLRGLGS
ncbi:MAG: GNAT family N-acetyltransferase [Rhodobacter sp.]|nr:GNAT family N-acetyltransferase [Rhodobacter sp.]